MDRPTASQPSRRKPAADDFAPQTPLPPLPSRRDVILRSVDSRRLAAIVLWNGIEKPPPFLSSLSHRLSLNTATPRDVICSGGRGSLHYREDLMQSSTLVRVVRIDQLLRLLLVEGSQSSSSASFVFRCGILKQRTFAAPFS